MPRPAIDPMSGAPIKNGQMQPAELKAIRGLVGFIEHKRTGLPGSGRPLSQKEFASRLNPPVSERTLRGWEKGTTPIPALRVPQLRLVKQRALRARRGIRP